MCPLPHKKNEENVGREAKTPDEPEQIEKKTMKTNIEMRMKTIKQLFVGWNTSDWEFVYLQHQITLQRFLSLRLDEFHHQEKYR